MSNERTWTLKVNEGELRALIAHNMSKHYETMTVESSSRIHDLTKRLAKDTPEIDNDPRPTQEAPQPQQEAAKAPGGW